MILQIPQKGQKWSNLWGSIFKIDAVYYDCDSLSRTFKNTNLSYGITFYKFYSKLIYCDWKKL